VFFIDCLCRQGRHISNSEKIGKTQKKIEKMNLKLKYLKITGFCG